MTKFLVIERSERWIEVEAVTDAEAIEKAKASPAGWDVKPVEHEIGMITGDWDEYRRNNPIKRVRPPR